jgi:hypothetical protein
MENIDGADRGKIWKNGNLYYTFPKNTISYVEAIYLQGTDVCAAGDDQYWINPTSAVPTVVKIPESYISSLFVSGSDVDAAGDDYGGTKVIAKVWKNRTATKLSDEESWVNSVFVWNNKVFAAGYEGSSVVWKDGKPTKLADKGDAYSVFVVDRP